MKRPLLLIILDGWGYSEAVPGNAVRLARPVWMTRSSGEYPFTLLESSGRAVGLPDGLMGNSEVGHLNIGAGRIVDQDIVRIDNAIEDGSFYRNPVLTEAFSFAESRHGKVHLLGLLSEGGVHSSLNHLLALIELSARLRFPSVYVHAFLDGRDMPPQSALSLIEKLDGVFKEKGTGRWGSVCGRYYAMDRDKRWDRLEKCYRALVLGEGPAEASPQKALQGAYGRGETDEFVQPTVIAGNGNSPARIADGDGVIFFNFRADRARQLTAALTSGDFSGFDLPRPKIYFCSMTDYDPAFSVRAAFKTPDLVNTLPEVWSKAGLSQFHTAETEKYAHVTYFFGGGRETPFPNEDRLMIPSLKVPTYDLAPQMAAPQITQAALSRIAAGQYDCIVMNFANADMVGHTGNLEATIQAVKAVDECVGKLVQAVLEQGGTAVITADHGNAEKMIDAQTGQPHTAHTASLVPFIFADPDRRGGKPRSGGILADIAPTILTAQGLSVPPEMTGKDLFLIGRHEFLKK